MHNNTYIDAFIDADKVLQSNRCRDTQDILEKLKQNNISLAKVCSSDENVLKAFENVEFAFIEIIKKIDTPCQINERFKNYYIQNLHLLSPPEVDEIVLALGKNKCKLYIEFARSLEEVGQIDKVFERSPARMLEEYGLLDRGATLIGCNHVDKDDLSVLALNEVEIVLTPVYDMQNGLGAVNLYPLMGCEIPFTVASGGSGFFDMTVQAKLALGNTANIMYSPEIYKECDLLSRITND